MDPKARRLCGLTINARRDSTPPLIVCLLRSLPVLSLIGLGACAAPSVQLADTAQFNISPVFLLLFLAFAAWRIISWILYLVKKSELDTQISAGSAQAVKSAGGPANTATVYVYRLPNFVGALSPGYIYCDQAPIAGLKSGAHAVCKVAPGDHVFTSSGSAATIPLSLQAGQTCFIRTGVTGLNSSAFETVSQERARAESSALRQIIDPNQISPEPPLISGEQARSATPAAPPVAPPPQPAVTPPPAASISAVVTPPAAISAPPAADSMEPKLQWYQHVWTALPFLLVVTGGIIGGACGGAAWGLNQQVFRKTKDPVLRYVWTGLISAGAVAAYLVVALLVASLLAQKP